MLLTKKKKHLQKGLGQRNKDSYSNISNQGNYHELLNVSYEF